MRPPLESPTSRLLVRICLVALTTASSGLAHTFTANSSLDLPDISPGDGLCDADAAPGTTCTLRAAVLEANALAGPDTVQLQSRTYTLTRAGSAGDQGPLHVTSELHILGVAGSVIEGTSGWGYRLFTVDGEGGSLELRDALLRKGDTAASGGCLSAAGVDVTLSGVELTQCQGSGGGGVNFSGGTGPNAGTLRIERAWLHGNQASLGGAIHLSSGKLLVIDSTISYNLATADGGGIFASGGSIFLTNVTVAGNFANRDGGGIGTFAGARVASSTIAFNFSDANADGDGNGGGIYALAGGQIRLRNSIVAGNENLDDFSTDDCDGAFASDGYNLIGSPGAACSGFSAATHDLVGAPLLDAKLGTLDDHGGPVPTLVPNPGSPLIDAGNPAGCTGEPDADVTTAPAPLTTDARGFPRALDPSGSGVPRCDIGAAEFAIFVDGFEVGDRSAWSATIG